jgi:hypothetical protein
MLIPRRGHTVIELLVSLAVGALVISLSATIGFRHQRFHRDVLVAVERSEQLGQLVAVMPISLRSIAPGEGDIAPGGARDTAIEFRATILSAVACDSSTTNVLLAPMGVTPRLAAVLARPEPGDTAWLLDVSQAVEAWTPRAITAVYDSSAACRVGASFPFGTQPRSSIVLRLAASPPEKATVLRVTRPWRYSLYRASEGGWFLGAKEWNAAQSRFNTIQPVAGPVLPPVAGGQRFRYIDSLGALLPVIPPDPRRIAAIELSFRVDSAIPGRYAHATSIRGRASAVVALRNR